MRVHRPLALNGGQQHFATVHEGSPGRNSTTTESTAETDVSDAVGAVLGAANQSDDSLRELIEIWGEVSPEIQHAILTIARQSRTS
ncbi:hypothetical protein Poly51_30170 [Rubripirellula tenax]|uniref:Uncharacterized protein n=1 Tax=Rubripirellula tenax TaxID=2528015 RepID=A0A5C6F154_9BACT|nr:hypothetical protein Poly51_30170 [Rubripirellula tenax]